MATEPWPRPPQRLHQQADLLYFETEGKGKTWTEIEFSIKSRKVEEKPRKKQNNFALLGTIRVQVNFCYGGRMVFLILIHEKKVILKLYNGFFILKNPLYTCVAI